jgi:hypothetical protein
MPPLHIRAAHVLPRLTGHNYRETSPATWDYSCIAWAVGITDDWWWPLPGRFWPEGVLREETLSAFLAAFSTIGFLPGASAAIDTAVEKVALYAIGATPTHAARQLPGGWWTSKLGPAIDIEYSTPDDVAGGAYGEVVAILSRKRPDPVS